MRDMKITDLSRNDVDRAVAYVREQLDRNDRVSDDDLHTLLQLQDDAERLIDALGRLDAERRAAGRPGFL